MEWTLSRRNWIVRWAFLGWGPEFLRLDRTRSRTNLCELFWLSVLFAPMVLFYFLLFAPIWVPIYLLVKIIQGCRRGWLAYRGTHPPQSHEPRPIPAWKQNLQYAWRAHKERFCPIIHLD